MSGRREGAGAADQHEAGDRDGAAAAREGHTREAGHHHRPPQTARGRQEHQPADVREARGTMGGLNGDPVVDLSSLQCILYRGHGAKVFLLVI